MGGLKPPQPLPLRGPWDSCVIKGYQEYRYHSAERHHRTYQTGVAVLPDPLPTYDPNLL